MITAKELRDKFDADLKEMQEKCKHENVSDWMDYMWAPGHFGLPVKVCRHCDKIVERKEAFEGLIMDNEEVNKSIDLGPGL